MRKYCLACDLKDDSGLIEEYKRYHSKEGRWPEIMQSIRDSGILNMEIYLLGNRLFMIMEVADYFSFDEKAKKDAENPRVREWENLMWKFQQALPWARNGEKWMLMDRIFELEQ